MVLEGDGSSRGGSSRDTPSSSVPGAVPQICMGPVGLLYDSMRTGEKQRPRGSGC